MFAYTLSAQSASFLLTLLLLCQNSLSTSTSSSSTTSPITTNLSPLSNSHPISGPLLPSIFADPSIIKVNNTYYAYATQTQSHIVPIATSPDFSHWTLLPTSALPHVGAWAAKGSNRSVWAPDVIQSPKGHFVMYYTAIIANHSATDDPRRCIGIATATNPEGPFQPEDKPVVCPPIGGYIDPAGFIDHDGQHYLLHKYVTNTTSIVLQPMGTDGLVKTGAFTTLVNATETESWNTEAPSLVRAGGSYVLFFSTGFWRAESYTVSVATAAEITGPYTKHSTPLLGTGSVENDLLAPGGADVLFVEDIDDDAGGGQTVHVVFHAAQSASELGMRHLWTGQVRINGTDVSI